MDLASGFDDFLTGGDFFKDDFLLDPSLDPSLSAGLTGALAGLFRIPAGSAGLAADMLRFAVSLVFS